LLPAAKKTAKQIADASRYSRRIKTTAAAGLPVHSTLHRSRKTIHHSTTLAALVWVDTGMLGEPARIAATETKTSEIRFRVTT
jgi:hypothetical protein